MDAADARRKAERALLEASQSSRASRKHYHDAARKMQEVLWIRGYGFSWGTADEFSAVLMEHPELLSMPLQKAADVLLNNLKEWAPILAEKERRAKAVYAPPPRAELP